MKCKFIYLENAYGASPEVCLRVVLFIQLIFLIRLIFYQKKFLPVGNLFSQVLQGSVQIQLYNGWVGEGVTPVLPPSCFPLRMAPMGL